MLQYYKIMTLILGKGFFGKKMGSTDLFSLVWHHLSSPNALTDYICCKCYIGLAKSSVHFFQ